MRGALAPFDPDQESFKDRVYALKDMVPPSTRAAVQDAAASAKSWLAWSVSTAGNAAWIVTTSALLVGMPLLLSIEGEAALVQQEKEYLAQPGAPNPYGAPAQPGAPAAGGAAAPAGLVPAGF
ncbi:mitochondrial import receptor subunit Tom22 [Rhodotorula kratochvilovae]